MSLKANVIRSSVLNVADQVVKLVAVFIITPLMIASLGEYRYGIWLILMTVFSYYNLFDLGTTLSGTRFVAQALGANDQERLKTVIGTCVRIFRRVAAAALAAGAVGTLACGWFHADPAFLPQIRLIVGLYAANVALRFVLRIYQVILKSHVRYDLIVTSSILHVAVQSVAVYLALQRGHGLLTLALIHIACEFLDSLLIMVFARRIARGMDVSSRHYSRPFARELLGYSFYSLLSHLGLHLRDRIDPLVIAGVSGPAVVPVYSIGARFIAVFRDLITSLLGGQFISAFSHIEAGRGPDALRASFLTVTRFSVLVTVFGGATILIYGRPFIERWIGPGFRDSYSILLILVVPFCLHFMQYPAWSLLYSIAKHRYITLITFYGGMANLCLSILMGLKWGLFGVVWATAIETAVVCTVFVPRIVGSAAGIRSASYLFRHLIGRAALFSAPLVLYYLLVRNLLAPDYLRLVLLGAGQVVFFAPFAWFGFLSAEERKEFLRALGVLPGTGRPPGRS